MFQGSHSFPFLLRIPLGLRLGDLAYLLAVLLPSCAGSIHYGAHSPGFNFARRSSID